jgi:hypothetical protein
MGIQDCGTCNCLCNTEFPPQFGGKLFCIEEKSGKIRHENSCQTSSLGEENWSGRGEKESNFTGCKLSVITGIQEMSDHKIHVHQCQNLERVNFQRTEKDGAGKAARREEKRGKMTVEKSNI